MPSDEEIRTVRTAIQRQVDYYAERGISRPATPIERAAFEQGRLAMLEWLYPDLGTEAEKSATIALREGQ